MAMREAATTTALEERGALPVDSNQADRSWFRTAARIGRELLIVGTFCGLYELLRTDVVQDGAQAAAHSLSVVHLETQLGIFHEAAIQGLFLRVPDVVKFFNLYYGGTHFLIPALALCWLALRHRESYFRARTALAVTTGIAFLIFWLFPVAPPRLLPSHFGIIDTLVTFHQSGHLEHSLIDSAGDIYAALPSLHVAWALWSTLALYPVVRHRALRAVLVAYPIVTTLVVVTTGNHFFLDAAAGSLLVTLVWFALPKAGDWRKRHFHDSGQMEMWVNRRLGVLFGSASLPALHSPHWVERQTKTVSSGQAIRAGHTPVGLMHKAHGHLFLGSEQPPHDDELDLLAEESDDGLNGPKDGSPVRPKSPFRACPERARRRGEQAERMVSDSQGLDEGR
jgi:PAP2 superfamily